MYKRFTKTQETGEWVEEQLSRLNKVEAQIEKLQAERCSLNNSQIQNLHLTANTIKASLGADASQLEPEIMTIYHLLLD